MGRGWLHLMVDEPEEARAALESARPTDVRGGSTRISLWAYAWLARAQFVMGDWDDAVRTAHEGLELVDRSGMRLVGPLLSWTQAQVLALRGDWEGAEVALSAGDAGPRDYEVMRVPACLARAQVAEARADYAGVVRALEPLRQPWAGGDIDEPGAWPWADVYANALVIEGRLDDADAFLGPHEELAAARGHRSGRARLGYARGRLLGARGDLVGARQAFDTSLDLLADLPLRYDRARVNFAYGQTLRRAGKRREADAVIATARDIYLALGATTYVARCDRELKAGGVHATRRAVDRPVDALTPQEEAVSELVAGGLSNREVAAELFVSMKTVQYHLTRVYAKLGVRSRAELAALRVPSPGAD
jgi:ATP/maltotriose-dependent transcriptional regulator MalT